MRYDDIEIANLRRRRGEKWSQYSPEVLPAWVADMDFSVCAPIQQLLDETIAIGDIGYPREDNPQELAAIFAQRMQRKFDWEIDPERVEVLTDVVQGLYLSLLAFSERGQGAIVQTPVYPPFLHAVPDTGRHLVANPLVSTTGRYGIDFDQLRGQIDRDTRLLLFCNPQNPTGRVFTRAELETLSDIVLEHDLIVCSDEIHADLIYPGAEHIPFATVSPEMASRTVTLTSATKAFNIAGLRCAVAVFGSGSLQTRFNEIPAHARGGISSLGLAATAIAWSEGQAWLDETVAYLDDNRKFVANFLRDHLPDTKHRTPEATYLAWVDCRDLDLSPDPYSFFLERACVALSDGRAFGPDGDGFVRINFATSRAILTQVLERMANAVHG